MNLSKHQINFTFAILFHVQRYVYSSFLFQWLGKLYTNLWLINTSNQSVNSLISIWIRVREDYLLKIALEGVSDFIRPLKKTFEGSCNYGNELFKWRWELELLLITVLIWASVSHRNKSSGVVFSNIYQRRGRWVMASKYIPAREEVKSFWIYNHTGFNQQKSEFYCFSKEKI